MVRSTVEGGFAAWGPSASCASLDGTHHQDGPGFTPADGVAVEGAADRLEGLRKVVVALPDPGEAEHLARGKGRGEVPDPFRRIGPVVDRVVGVATFPTTPL